MSENTRPKPFVFVLMPFGPEFNDIYELGIKPACQSAGAYCERVDEQFYDGSILDRIYNQIAKADLIVADMSSSNSNVFYETGYAHALNKRVVLLTQDVGDIPFDLKHQLHIVYTDPGKILSLKSQLEAKVRWGIQHPLESLTGPTVQIQFVVNGVPLSDAPTIEADMREFSSISSPDYNLMVYFSLSIQNLTNKVLNPESFRWALIMSQPFFAQASQFDQFHTFTRLPDGRDIYTAKPLTTLFPEAWETVNLQFSTYGMRIRYPESPIPLVVRLFTEFGPSDYPFTLQPVMLEPSET